MSSAAAASLNAFGVDRGLPFPLTDMPPVMQYFSAQQTNGDKLIVVDPRRSATAEWATLHLRLRPGSDAVRFEGFPPGAAGLLSPPQAVVPISNAIARTLRHLSETFGKSAHLTTGLQVRYIASL